MRCPKAAQQFRSLRLGISYQFGSRLIAKRLGSSGSMKCKVDHGTRQHLRCSVRIPPASYPQLICEGLKQLLAWSPYALARRPATRFPLASAAVDLAQIPRAAQPRSQRRNEVFPGQGGWRCSRRGSMTSARLTNTSDSNGMGVWAPDGGTIKGKFVEVTADRTTRQFVSRGEISFLIRVNGNAFTGTASAIFYDADGRRLRGPLPATLEGQRIVL